MPTRHFFILVALIVVLPIQWQLAQLPPFHDAWYRSPRYLLGIDSSLPNSTFQQPITRTPWASDWKRQLLLHPPGNYALSSVWGYFLGFDSLSLALLSLLVSYVGLFFWHRILALTFGRKLASSAILLVLVSSSFLWYSVIPVDAIFEFAAVGIGIHGLFALVRKERAPWAFLQLIIGLLFSYHFLLFLILAPLCSPKIIRRAPWLAACSLAILPICYILWGIGSDAYSPERWRHWPHSLPWYELLVWLRDLPVRVKYWSEEQVAPLMSLHGLGALAGFLVLAVKRRTWRSPYLRFALMVAALPVLLYYVMHALFGAFGHQRNFFYLLPLLLVLSLVPFKRGRLLTPSVIVWGALIIYSGITFIVPTGHSLLNSFGPTILYASERTSLPKATCVALETHEYHYAANDYLASAHFAHSQLRWFLPKDRGDLCRLNLNSCSTLRVYSSQEAPLECAGSVPIGTAQTSSFYPPLFKLFEAESPRIYLWEYRPKRTLP